MKRGQCNIPVLPMFETLSQLTDIRKIFTKVQTADIPTNLDKWCSSFLICYLTGRQVSGKHQLCRYVHEPLQDSIPEVYARFARSFCVHVTQ